MISKETNNKFEIYYGRMEKEIRSFVEWLLEFIEKLN